MNWLLDTCVISEARKKTPSPKVMAWLGQQEESALFLSAITIGELHKGAARLEDPKRRRQLLGWIHHELAARFHRRILPFDDVVATRWGDLMAAAETSGQPLPTLDSLIAATALTHRLTITTRNTADFARTGADIFNPWD